MEADRERRVVVGVSGSLANLAALHCAVDCARELGAEVIAVRAWLPAGGEIAYRRGPCPPLLELWRERAFDRLATAFADAFGGLPPDLNVRPVTGRGETGPVLVSVADRPRDLLVVGTGRQGPISSRRPGSVSRYCLRHSGCPVLVVPQPEMIRKMRSIRRPDQTRRNQSTS